MSPRFLVLSAPAVVGPALAARPHGRAAVRESGRFIYEAGKAFGVLVGRGGPEIALVTPNGDILIHKTNTTRRIP